MADTVEEQETEEQFVDDYNESPPADIVAYNELRSCADLHRMYGDGSIDLKPEFQRDFIWNGTDQTRFIDSLIKQLPIPSMCFAFDAKQGLWIVIDGLQRISTIIRFLNGEDWKLSPLADIDKDLAGKNAATIKNAKGPLAAFYRRVQNQSLPINVLRCDFTKRSHNEYLFTIFHRLNSGGIRLNSQEIRNCIYSGSFNETLKALDQESAWRRINRMALNENYRFTKQEAILRFFAFLERQAQYKGSVAKFLNDYMYDNRHAKDDVIDAKKALFGRVTAVVSSKIFQPEVPRLPGTVLEAVLIGVARNIDHVEAREDAHVRARYEDFRAHESVSDASLAEGLSKKDKVDARLDAATAIFAK